MKRQIHLKPEDLNKSDKLGLTYNLGQAHKRMLLKQSGIMQKSMIDKGLVRKERMPEDARKYRLFLTEKAKQVEQASRQAAKDLDKTFYEGVSESDMRIFKGVLGQIMRNLDMI